MGNFNRGRKFGGGGSRGRPDFRGPRGFGRGSDRDSDRPEGPRRRDRDFVKDMHTVICDKCGTECEVPFKPTAGKPVYCSDCFRKGEGSGSESRGSGNAGNFDPVKKEFEKLNKKLDKIMEALDIE